MEVRAEALRANLRTLRERVGPGPAMMPMVKADGYGLGMLRAVRALEPEDPWGWGVATVEEGRELRAADPDRPILVASPVPPGSYPDVVEARLTPAISDVPALRQLAAAVRSGSASVDFHVEVDTGMGRAGFDWRESGRWGREVSEIEAGVEGFRWSGCFTHFHSADRADDSSIRTQWERFVGALESVPGGGGGKMLHACNSAAALRCPELAADGVRPGIFLYGGAAGEELPESVPAVRLRARIVHVRDAPPGTTVGYGATHAARSWARWATVAVGYGDGLPRALSNRGHGLLRGRRVPVVGRISMDVTVVDISEVDAVEVGEVVTFLGRDGEETIGLEEVAAHAGTVSYEVLTGLSRRLPRIWIEEGGR